MLVIKLVSIKWSKTEFIAYQGNEGIYTIWLIWKQKLQWFYYLKKENAQKEYRVHLLSYSNHDPELSKLANTVAELLALICPVRINSNKKRRKKNIVAWSDYKLGVRTLPSQARWSFYMILILYSWWVVLAWGFLYSNLRSSHCSIPILGNVIVPENIPLEIHLDDKKWNNILVHVQFILYNRILDMEIQNWEYFAWYCSNGNLKIDWSTFLWNQTLFGIANVLDTYVGVIS